MQTLILHIKDENDPQLETAARILREGGTVIFPTETVYGLGANGLSAEAAGRIYAAKGRPSDNPLILHIADWRQISQVAAVVPPVAEALARHFWPGPLTLILQKAGGAGRGDRRPGYRGCPPAGPPGGPTADRLGRCAGGRPQRQPVR